MPSTVRRTRRRRVPVVGASSWDVLAGRVVTVAGQLVRHAFENDPETGLSSLELHPTTIEPVDLPDWTKNEVTPTVRVTGRVSHDELPPGAPPAGGSWTVTASG